MSFTVDMTAVYQQFANVFGSMTPLLWPFIGALLALFVFGGIIGILKAYQNRQRVGDDMSLVLNYDINLFYQAFSSTMTSLWPIIAPAFGILLAGLVLGGIMAAFHKFKES